MPASLSRDRETETKTDRDIRVTLRKKAFHPDGGPLADKSQVAAEREADVHLLSGGMGHAR